MSKKNLISRSNESLETVICWKNRQKKVANAITNKKKRSDVQKRCFCLRKQKPETAIEQRKEVKNFGRKRMGFNSKAVAPISNYANTHF